MDIKKPLPHQEAALADIRKGLKKNRRGQVLMTCGTGKSLVALWAAKDSKHVLVLVPSLQLVSQIYREWCDPNVIGNAASRRWLAVCSDPSVTKRKAEGDLSLAELQEQLGTTVVNDPLLVNAFLCKAETSVVICTYQSVPVLAAGMPGKFSFDMGVFDEAHKTAGLADKLFAVALKEKSVKIKNRVFYTATPRRSKYQSDEQAIFHMDDPKIYGPVFHELSFKSAVAQGLVADYDVILAVIQRPDVTRENILADKNAALLAKTLIVNKTIEQYGITKVFSFHETNVVAATAQGFYQENDDFEVYRVSGEESALERTNTLLKFKNAKRAIVTNARCLGEGVNVPVCDAVAFLTPRRSRVDVVQAVGRACRLNRDEPDVTKRASVILPIFLEAGETMEEATKRSAFGDAFATLDILREHNEILADDLRKLREQIKSPEAPGPERIDEGHIKLVVAETLAGGIAQMSVPEFKRAFRVHMAKELKATVKEKIKMILELAAKAKAAKDLR